MAYYKLFLLICCCNFLRFTTSIDTIIVNQSVHDSDTLVSNGGRFKLGIFSPPNSSYRYVGVMYNLPVFTPIWIVNRDKPLNDSKGSMEVSSDGNLVLLDGQKAIVWSTNLSYSGTVNHSVVLLDTGNLVLQDNSNNNKYLWESFEHASDSFVEDMRLFTDSSTNKTNGLTSWRSPSDPGSGRFTATVEPEVIPELLVWKEGEAYWHSGPWNGQIFTGIPHMESFYKRGFDLASDPPRYAYLNFTNVDSSVLYTRLGSSGALYSKMWDVERGEWKVTWASMESECDVYGRCGPFGRCDARGRPICRCLRGFEAMRKEEWKAGNWSSGCRRRMSLGCERKSEKEDGFLKIEKVKWPYRYKWFPTAEEGCRKLCLDNCSCVAYAFAAGIGCIQWDDELLDVQKVPDGGLDLYIRLPHQELGNKKDRKTIIAMTVVLGFITIAICTFFLLKKLLNYRGYSEESKLQHAVHGVKLEDKLHLFKFQMISNATGHFNLMNKLGQGGFGPVYKGKLENGQEIGVKRLARSSMQGVEEFMNEVEVISRLQHRNLVRLLGCCVESHENMLVYEYMPNGSLDTYLFDSRREEVLEWKKRVVIIEGICRGLLYLHRDSRLRIIHRDLKASNILLDEELNPKISDFGMARIFGGKDDRANTTRVVGTYGYMSPEYALRGIFSEKSDVYSLGVLLLEIVSGRRNSHFYGDDQQLFLIAYAWKLWNEGHIIELMDPSIYDPKFESDVVRYANIGLLCVEEMAENRPNISTVLMMFGCEIAQLPSPKKPAFVGIQRLQETQFCKIKLCSVNDVTISIVEGR